MKILQKIWNFFDQYSSLILLILMINLMIVWLSTSAKGTYFWISDITLLVISIISITNSYIKYRKKKLLNEL